MAEVYCLGARIYRDDFKYGHSCTPYDQLLVCPNLSQDIDICYLNWRDHLITSRLLFDFHNPLAFCPLFTFVAKKIMKSTMNIWLLASALYAM